MDARIKIVITLLFIVASFLIDDFLGFAVLLPLLVAIGDVSKIPLGYVLRGSRFFIAFLVFILIFQVLFYPGDVPESDYFWQWGILSVSREGLYAAGIIASRVILLYFVITMLMLTTSLVDLTNGLELVLGPLQRLRVPVNELVLVFVIAIKFVPVFIEEMERLARAQTARGVPIDEGGAITRARRIGRLLVPIFISGLMGRTKLRRMQANLSDWLVLALVIVWIITAWMV
jgi:energy-coupling factor transport system permease protein